nr:recombinase zinc beta ribbon domain-containing protein [Actinopolymorpha pittospori]
MVLAHDQDRIGYVREMVVRAFARESLYGLARWLETSGVEPRSRSGRRDSARWHEASVEAILRAPALAGMTTYTPGRKPGEKSRADVLRDVDGLPVVDESTAIITPAERRELLAILDAAKLPGTRQRAGAEPALLYGLARCGSCGGLMYRATAAQGAARQYRCQQRGCPAPVSVNRGHLEAYVVSEFLATIGRLQVVELEPVEAEDPAPALVDIEHAISETLASMAEDGADVAALTDRLATLKSARSKAREAETAAPEVRTRRTGETFAEAWSKTEGVEARRGLLLSALEAVDVAPSPVRGRYPVGKRASLRWSTENL